MKKDSLLILTKLNRKESKMTVKKLLKKINKVEKSKASIISFNHPEKLTFNLFNLDGKIKGIKSFKKYLRKKVVSFEAIGFRNYNIYVK